MTKKKKSAREDQQQMIFSSEGSLKHREPEIIYSDTSVDMNMIVRCPFCLHMEALKGFLVSTKKGISQFKAHCPECNTGMLMKTLLWVWSPKIYAKWVFEYSLSGFWQKCKFEIWKERLNELGWAEEFWDYYKELKARRSEDHEESYEDMMNRRGEEWAQEHEIND